MRRWLFAPVVSVIVLAASWARVDTARADTPRPDVAPTTQPEKFIRFVDRGVAGGELDTADVRFKNADGVIVDLVAAVHIGEHAYFESLNKSFVGYDAVLYELVSPKNSGPPMPGVTSANPISQLQHFLKEALDLDFQLDVIDYSKSNFVHADLDKETFEQLQSERGESFASLMLKQLMDAWTHPPKVVDPEQTIDDQLHDVVQIMCRPDAERQFKLLLARQMDSMEANAMGLGGADGTVIVTERNKAAFAVLSDEIMQGKKKIAIFYGAAHMPDMAKRLTAMGFAPVDTTWTQAWDLTIRSDQPSIAEKLMDGALDALEHMGDNN